MGLIEELTGFKWAILAGTLIIKYREANMKHGEKCLQDSKRDMTEAWFRIVAVKVLRTDKK